MKATAAATKKPNGIPIEPIVEHRPRRRVGQVLPLREDLARRRRVAPVREAVEDQVVEDQRGDVVEHQRGDDLVRVQERPQQAGDRRPRGPEGRAADDHRHDQHRRRLARQEQRDAGRADRAEVELALAADVEQAHAERDGGREAREGERRRRDERRREGAVGQVGRVEEPPERLDRRMARWPARRIAIAMWATTSEPSGTATSSQRRRWSRFSMRISGRVTPAPRRLP